MFSAVLIFLKFWLQFVIVITDTMPVMIGQMILFQSTINLYFQNKPLILKFTPSNSVDLTKSSTPLCPAKPPAGPYALIICPIEGLIRRPKAYRDLNEKKRPLYFDFIKRSRLVILVML